MRLTYTIDDIVPYINWAYFYFAWNMHNKPDEDRDKLRREAEDALRQQADKYHTYAIFEIYDAEIEGDDLMLEGHRFPLLRQQQADSSFLCLSDFVRPHDRVGVFATTVDAGLETDFNDDPYQKMMMQLLADRLAEATAERMHEEVRKRYWGYTKDEHLSMADMQAERFQGIRPAVGYPSLPDTSLNFVIDELIDMKQIGIRLTESGAMRPLASVSGLMISHPQSRYFSIGKIGEDQLTDYALRRGLPVEICRKFLAANL